MWLADINNSISKLEKNGTSHDAAVAESLLESVFVSNVDLYLKLTNASVDADHCEKIQDQMNIMCSVKEEQVKEQERIQAIEAENNQLHEQLDCLRHKNAEFEEKVQILEQEKKLLQTSLSEAQNKCSITSNAQSDDRLSKYDDRNPSVLHYIGSEETVSLCEITTDYNGKNGLLVMLILRITNIMLLSHETQICQHTLKTEIVFSIQTGLITTVFTVFGSGIVIQMKKTLPKTMLNQNITCLSYRSRLLYY